MFRRPDDNRPAPTHLERHFSFLAITHQRRRVADHRFELFSWVIGPHLPVETHHAQNLMGWCAYSKPRPRDGIQPVCYWNARWSYF
jgi:hypothetical protein